MNKQLWVGLLLVLLTLSGCEGKEKAPVEKPKTNTNELMINSNSAPQATQPVETKQNESPTPSVGKALHEKNCISCHDTGMYTRVDRKITDFPSLLAQVRRCDANLETSLFDEEMEQIANYLNQDFYHFKQ